MSEDDFTPEEEICEPSFAEEAAEWRKRAHILWLDSFNSADLRGQAAALTAGFKALEQWQKELETKAEEDAKAIDPTAPFGYNEAGQPYLTTPEVEDVIIAKVENYYAKKGLNAKCPVCDGLGRTNREISSLVMSLFGESGLYRRDYMVAAGLEENSANADSPTN